VGGEGGGGGGGGGSEEAVYRDGSFASAHTLPVRLLVWRRWKSLGATHQPTVLAGLAPP